MNWSQMVETHNIEKLNQLASEAEQCDKQLFAEQRTNILLSAGEHYSRTKSNWWNRIRDSKDVSNEQKVRLTKNHIYKIVRTYLNNIISQAPGVIPIPNNPKELQDQKAAELNKSVWQYAKNEHSLNIEIQKWAKAFIEIGECFVKIYWDPNKGRFLGYEQEVIDGQPSFDPTTGQPVQSDRAVFSGGFCFDHVFAANILRSPDTKSMWDSPYLIERKMVSIADLKAMFPDDPDMQKKIQPSKDETFFVFDPNKQGYSDSKNETMIMYYYFRPCVQYPQGYYYMATKTDILFEGELPYGVFPIEYVGWDEIATTPRHRSIIKQLRPYQVEINRSGSKMAEHQVTLGDDKVLLLNGSKYTSGPHLPGIRVGYVTGQAPTIVAGRTGEQYLPYMQSQIAELYQVANLPEDSEEINEQQDPYAKLYGALKDRKKFKIYTDKFEDFLCRVCKLYLTLARQYFDEEMLIPQVGRSEYVNISEFKNTNPLCYQIKVEPQSDDIETMMGRHLVLNHLLQYAGPNLDKDTIGKIIKQMPFMNNEGLSDDLTLNYDTATNIILALDRGQDVHLRKYDDPDYIGKRLTGRCQASDFQLLSPEIQAKYEALIQECEAIGVQNLQELKQAESQFIPSGGASVKCDFYVPDPTNKGRSTRATLPAEAVDWLLKQLASQGSTQEMLAGQNKAVQSDMARMLMEQQQAQPTQGSGGSPINGVMPREIQ